MRFATTALVGIGTVTLALSLAGEVRADSPSVYHVPRSEAGAGDSIEIVAKVSRGWQANLEVLFRPLGTEEWRHVPFERRSETSYRALIGGDQVHSPGLEYYIASFTDAAEMVHFASAADPFPIYVAPEKAAVLEASELSRFDNHRASFRFAGEFVDFGSRDRDNGERVRDSYYRVDADFTYRLFRFPLRAFRLGFTQMLGDTPVTERGLEDCPTQCEQTAGFRAGGWAELRWRLTDNFDVDTRILIQATPDGFGFGGRGEVRFGDETATHFAIGGEAITEVGTDFFVRLGWATVPRVPMAASIHLTDYPSSHRDHGVRIVYDLAYEVGYGLRLGGRIGYQARDQNIGGAAAGLNATLEF